MTAIFVLLAAVALMLALHPYVTFPLSLIILARFRNRPQLPVAESAVKAGPLTSPETDRPEIAILLCVHNEENIIHGRIDYLLELADSVPCTQILVYSDGSTDGTNDILRSYEHRITLVESTERHGKTHGMNLLVSLTSCRLIVFTDAAVRIGTDALTNVIRHFEDPDVGCVCGQIIAVVGNNEGKTSSTSDTSIKYWAFDALIRQLETRITSVIGAHGPLFAIRHELHEPPPVDVFDDFYLSMAILYNGHRVVQADDVIGFKETATKREDEYARKIRISCQAFHVHRLMKTRLQQQTLLIRYLYAGHKTLRWLTIFSLAGAIFFATLALLSANFHTLVIVAWVVFAGILTLGYAGVKPCSWISEALLLLMATGIGVIQSIRGDVYQTWSSAASSRRTHSTDTTSRQ